MRPCLLINPRSFRSSWMGYARRASRLALAAGLEVHEAVDPHSLREVLERLRARRVQQIWVLAGDGTLIALAAYLAELADDWSPALLLLAGGRANIVPRDVGGYPAMPALRRALAALAARRPLQEERILTLRISQAGMPVRHGFLFAGALAHEAVRLCAANRALGPGWWRQSWFSDPWILLRWAVRTLLLRRPLPPAPEVSVRMAGGAEWSAPMRIVLASTLEMRNALANPFARRGSGPVRLTAIAAGARFWRLLPALLRGRLEDGMQVRRGVLSGRAGRTELQGIADYALDGELFTADPTLPLELAPGIALRIVRA